VALFLSRSITRPIRALTAAADEIAQGRYEKRVPVNGEDELGQLARRFNVMAGEVQRARQTERDLLSNVTHDLRTPLTSIQGFAQALLDGTVEDPASFRRAAGIIYDEAGQMRRLIDDLLDLARFEAGAAPLCLEPLETGPWLQAIAGRLAPRVEAADLTWQTELAEPLPAIRADARRLEQAISNLVDNACKYTAAAGSAGGPIRLEARAVQARQRQCEHALSGEVVVGKLPWREGLYLAIRIADSGRGIAPEDRRRIFERFYRADRARTETPGSGLGLAIVREIVLAHGGLLALQSEPGKGAAFTLLLPAV
jgi:signal transduction histidine kinase